jgi:hypothetical protein
MNEIGIVAAIFSAFADLVQLVRNPSSSKKKEDSNMPITSLIEQQSDEPYRVGLGRRHRFLREEILELNPAEMSRFYGFKKVSHLEDCERGLDEFSFESINRLTQVFFISSKYLEEDQKKYPTPIFEPFDIISTKKDSRCLLEQDFKPSVLCSPNFDEDGFAYIIFWKKEEGYYRMRQSNTQCYFYSLSGGGAHNLYNFIDAMLDLDLKPTWENASWLTVRSDEWEKLERGCWYNMGLSYPGAANHKAWDIFKDRYEMLKNSRIETLER